MRNEVQHTAGVLAEKRGVPIYTSNPSVPSADEIKKPKRTRLGTELRGLGVDNGSGEVLGHGCEKLLANFGGSLWPDILQVN